MPLILFYRSVDQRLSCRLLTLRLPLLALLLVVVVIVVHVDTSVGVVDVVFDVAVVLVALFGECFAHQCLLRAQHHSDHLFRLQGPP